MKQKSRLCLLSRSFGSNVGFAGNPAFPQDNRTVTTAPIIIWSFFKLVGRETYWKNRTCRIDSYTSRIGRQGQFDLKIHQRLPITTFKQISTNKTWSPLKWWVVMNSRLSLSLVTNMNFSINSWRSPESDPFRIIGLWFWQW